MTRPWTEKQDQEVLKLYGKYKAHKVALILSRRWGFRVTVWTVYNALKRRRMKGNRSDAQVT